MTLWALKCKVRYWKSVRDKFPHIETETGTKGNNQMGKQIKTETERRLK